MECAIMPSVNQLVQRLSDEVNAARERLHSLQTEATQVFHGREQRFQRFVALADRIRAILQPRIEALTEVNVFKDVKKSVSLERQGSEGLGLHEETTTLSVPYSEESPAKVVLSFRVSHDGAIENAVIEYDLEILPIYIKFDSHVQLLVPLDNPSDEAIAAWLDDRLVEFTRTYLALSFTDQYQTKSLETDPVMNVQFPRAFAAGKKEDHGRTYYFYTKESLQDFEKAPSDYVGTAS
jgi:YHS domain-containing protein